jgi:hypothetical protein
MKKYSFLHTKYDQVLYVSKNHKIEVDPHKDIALVLSPQFYWVKHVELPVKSVVQAKKLAASTFEGFLPSGEYEYICSHAKESGKFILIAYDTSEIYNQLKLIVSDIKAVKALYFAQVELSNLDKTLYIANEQIFMMHENIVQVPAQSIDSFEHVNNYLSNIEKLSKHKIKPISNQESKVSKKLLYFALFVGGVFFATHVVEAIFYKYQIDKIEAKKEQLRVDRKLPKTNFELENIKDKLMKIDDEQIKIRKFFSFLNNLPLYDSAKINEITLEKDEALLYFDLNNSKNGDSIIEYLSQRYYVKDKSLKKKNFLLRVEI